ncbi:hypothetical protein [Luteibacter jiangsuensis]
MSHCSFDQSKASAAGAGAPDWTDIAPNGDVITGDHEGNAVNHGNYKDFLP